MVKDNNIIKFKYYNKNYNVPINAPWNVYLTSDKPNYKIDDNLEFYIDRSDEEINYFILNLTNKCNLDCSYCFEKNKDNYDMNPMVLDKFINFVIKRELKEISIRLFGGEPLLNLSLLEDTLIKLNTNLVKKGIKINYNIFTNGTLINERALDLITKYNIMLFVSLDGCKDMHDNSRKDKYGQPTYDIIIKNIKKVQKRLGQNIMIRTILNPNLEYSLIDIMDSFVKQGLYIGSIEFPWVDKEDKYSLNDLKNNMMIDSIRNYGIEYIKRVKEGDYSLIGLAPFSKIIVRLINKDFKPIVRSCCAGVGAIAVATNGNIYPCHSFVGNKEFLMGNLDDGITNNELYNKFNDCTSEKIEECNKCAINYFCNRRCPADSFFYNKRIDMPNKYKCALEKEIFKTCIYIFDSLRDMPNELKMVRLLYNKYTKINFYV